MFQTAVDVCGSAVAVLIIVVVFLGLIFPAKAILPA